MIVNFRPVLPERWLQRTHDPQMIELQLYHLHIAWKILLHIERANVQAHYSRVPGVSILGLNYHVPPPEGEPEYGVY